MQKPHLRELWWVIFFLSIVLPFIYLIEGLLDFVTKM